MYRAPSPPEEPLPPAEFAYDARERRRGPPQILMQLFLMPLVAGVVATSLFGITAGGVVTVATFAMVFRWWKPAGERRVLRVENEELRVFSGRSQEPRLRLLLSELADVELDSKTIQNAVEGDSAIPAMRLADMRAGPEVDVTRIVLVASDGTRTRLSDEHLDYTETSAAFGKLRVFLRKHGWTPESERHTPSDGSN